ncbi:YgfZ/GcvT domain-containing protein [Rhodoferax sp.]|uniref:CAF17-like 4Fe-4S cluster assembly/insertion protein YgfZ n=1 Tax=Rhodoferax sp. TaxID=50421 RepID=UPI00276AEDE7|nr:folate-binding protein [Rhodoferax sp.]
MRTELRGLAPLLSLGVIRVEGDDAAKFLHGQLTQDFSLLGLSEARLAALCSPKGRMLASFIGFKRGPTDILLICSRDLLTNTAKRLSMFVMRAKAKVSDATADFALYGLAGDVVDALVPAPRAVWSRHEVGAGSLIALYPADGVARALWLVPVGEPAPAGPTLSAEQWAWSEVRSGIATLSAPIVEGFVPQMLNYESVGGVNFKKGCYPGQEVVARSQFRGTLKRRACLVHGDAPMAAGAEVFQSSDTEQPCGTVVQAAAAPLGGFDAIVSAQVSAIEAADLRLGSATGPALAILPLPYPLLADI